MELRSWEIPPLDELLIAWCCRSHLVLHSSQTPCSRALFTQVHERCNIGARASVNVVTGFSTCRCLFIQILIEITDSEAMAWHHLRATRRDPKLLIAER